MRMWRAKWKGVVAFYARRSPSYAQAFEPGPAPGCMLAAGYQCPHCRLWKPGERWLSACHVVLNRQLYKKCHSILRAAGAHIWNSAEESRWQPEGGGRQR